MLFIDTSDIKEIKKYTDLGLIDGITTNQKILLKDKQTNLKKTITDILSVAKGCPVNIELTNTSGTDEDLIHEAAEYYDFSHEQIVIKIPMWGDGRGLRIAKELRKIGAPTNITCCMSTEQVLLAAYAEVDYVSLFMRRIADYNEKSFHYFDYKTGKNRILNGYGIACKTISDCRKLLDKGFVSQLIVGSIRLSEDVINAYLSGADIVTVPPKILELMFKHAKTDETICEFDRAWKELKNA